MRFSCAALVLLLSWLCVCGAFAEQCGVQAGGAKCPNGLCCSQWGWCGRSPDYCCLGCQSQCSCEAPEVRSPPPPAAPLPPLPPPGTGVSEIVTEELFNNLLLNRASYPCRGGFYTYESFLRAANRFPEFGTWGDMKDRKREIAAFLAQTSHETTGGWAGAPGGQYSWGYCWIHEGGVIDTSLLTSYCVPNLRWPCTPGEKYYGRGPIQLSYNFNYGQAGEALGYDLLNNPDLVETNSTVSFETALWFWMTPQFPKPSCHDVILGNWNPSQSDVELGRLPGFGLTTNIINGGIECGRGAVSHQEADRIGYFRHFTRIFDVDVGDHVSCAHQSSYSGFALQQGTEAA